MPRRPLRGCAAPGCPALIPVNKSYCPTHEHIRKEQKRQYEKERNQTPGRQMAMSYKWKQESKIFLQRHPYCEYCAEKGRQTLADVVDHVLAHKGNPNLFWDQSNWKASCRSCNSSKCASMEGGFGNRMK